MLAFLGANHLRKDFVKPLERFNKIYVHKENDNGGENFVKRACEVFPYEKLYIVSSNEVNPQCKDPSDLHIAEIFDKDTFLATAKKIDKDFYNNVNSRNDNDNDSTINTIEDKKEEHVLIAEQIMSRMEIRYYHENFYVYENGVYRPNLHAIESEILSIKKYAKKHLRNEIQDYIRICKTVSDLDICQNFINFKNGMFDLINRQLIPHTPKLFTTCQLNAYYFEPDKLIPNQDIENFLDGITNNDMKKKQCLLQIIGYCMTYRTDFQLAFILYGPSANNGKSTFIELINTMISKENVSHVTMGQLCERFKTHVLADKLLNTETEIEKKSISSIEMFKKVVTSDDILIEEKYKPAYTIKPFCKLLYGSNNLPELDNIDDEGYYRRLFIMEFTHKFTKEEVNNFDKNKIFTREALDYLANISLREFLKIEKTRTFECSEDSDKIINFYRLSNNSVVSFLEDDVIIKKIFANGNIVPKTVFYAKYIDWCKQNGFFVKKKKEFYVSVASSPEYQELKSNGGYDCYKNINYKSKSVREKEVPKVF